MLYTYKSKYRINKFAKRKVILLMIYNQNMIDILNRIQKGCQKII